MISFEKSVGAVVFRKTEEGIKYLLLDYGDNYWGFAKGHIEENETEEETMRRELKEETEITDINIIPGFYAKSRYFYRTSEKEKEWRRSEGKKTLIMKRVRYFLVETKNINVIISKEHIGFEWLEFKKAFERTTYRGPKRILRKADRYLSEQLN